MNAKVGIALAIGGFLLGAAAIETILIAGGLYYVFESPAMG
jgi:hypothetical protein